MSYFTKRSKRIVAGTLAGALALSVSPILGLTGIASAADALPPIAEPIGDGNFCEDAPTTEPFTDVSASDPSLDEIICLVATNLTKGTTPTTYSPNASITRRQMALFIKRLADLANTLDTGTQIAALPADDGTTAPFTDIEGESAETKAAISQLNTAGIVQGTTATSYSPGANVSRRQMAAFINRLEKFLTGAEFTTTKDFFNDDNGDTGEANLNAVASVGIFQGDGAGNVFPGANLTRRQMANVLLRHAQVMMDQGDIKRAFPEDDAGCGVITSEGGGTYTFTDNATKASVTVTHDATNDTFTVDGAAASRGAFDAATTVGDQVCFTDDTTAGDPDADKHALTNVAQSAIVSGVIGNIDDGPDTFSIIDPVSGVAISDVKDYTGGIFFVDGAVANEGGFEGALSEGDTVVIETDAALNKTFRLTNQAVTGTVSAVDTALDLVRIGNLGDDPLTAQDTDYDYVNGATTNTYLIGGAAATLAQFDAAVTVGDQLTYTRAANVQTFSLTNVAPPAVTGLLTETFDTAADTATLHTGAALVPIDYSGSAVFRVNGVAVTEAEFEAATMTAGDSITYQPDNPDTPADEESIARTDATLSGGLEAISTALDEYDVIPSPTSTAPDIYDDVVYTGAVFGGIDRYFVNNAEVTLAVFEQYLTKVAADLTPDDTIQVVDNGDISTDHKLTTDETLP